MKELSIKRSVTMPYDLFNFRHLDFIWGVLIFVHDPQLMLEVLHISLQDPVQAGLIGRPSDSLPRLDLDASNGCLLRDRSLVNDCIKQLFKL